MQLQQIAVDSKTFRAERHWTVAPSGGPPDSFQNLFCLLLMCTFEDEHDRELLCVKKVIDFEATLCWKKNEMTIY